MARRLLQAAEISQAFNDASVSRLAERARLQIGSDQARFGESVRSAVRRYIADAARPTQNALHREIARLYRLAERRKYQELAQAIDAMSAAARALLTKRLQIGRAPHWRLPTGDELSDPATRDQAAAGFMSLLEIGGAWGDGRMRPTGRRSRTWRPLLPGPEPSRSEPRRKAERMLVIWLQVAVAETGAPVALTGHHYRPGPFARFVAEVLIVVGAAGRRGAGAPELAVQLLNDLHSERLRRRSRNLSHMFS